MGQMTTISATAQTFESDSDYQHRELIDAINSVARMSGFDSVDYEYNCQMGVDVETEANVTVYTESDEQDRKHRKAVEKVQEQINNRNFDRRVMRFTTEHHDEWHPEQLGEVSETDPENHKAEVPIEEGE